jgi:hypothetical protein
VGGSAKVIDLAGLLAPISVQTFLDEYWAKRSLFVKGTADKFRDLFDRKAFDRAIRRPDAKGGPIGMRAVFDSVPAPPGKTPQFPITADRVESAYAAGATICASGIHLHDDKLERFVSAIRAELGYPGLAVCHSYLSPHGCGFGRHFDARIASTLQLEGSKWWKFSSAASVDWPPSNATYDEGGPYYFERDHQEEDWAVDARKFSEDDYTEVLLEPGDLLILPAGTWHSARAEGHSLAINLGFESSDVATLIGNMLRNRFESDSEWRAFLPHGNGSRMSSDAHLQARMLEAADFLRTALADGQIPRRAWGQAVMTKSGPKASPARSSQTSGRPIEPDDRLATPPGVPIYLQEVNAGQTVILYVGEHSVEVQGASRGFVRELHSRRSFVASEATAWFSGRQLPWDELKATLESLVADGILEHAS